MNTEVLNAIMSSVILMGIVALLAFGRKIASLPGEMRIVKASVFHLLGSNKIQGHALKTIALSQKRGLCNGETEEAVKAVEEDQKEIDRFLCAAAMGKIDKEDRE